MSFFVVDFDRIAFTIPYFGHPVTWYGLFFAAGFFLGFFIGRQIFKIHLESILKTESEAKQVAHTYADKLIVFIILGTIIGARLGHVFFYEWSYYKHHLLNIFKIWEGGLASHGGAIGVILALIIFFFWSKKKYPFIRFLAVLDSLVIPTAMVGGFIRLGNFINQEILGKPTEMPWGVIFLHPLQKVDQIPLHPVQLYESFSYFAIFFFLLFLWYKQGKKVGSGIISATFFILVFGFRFLIEFFKMPQTDFIDESFLNMGLNMGQLLSLPFICAGIVMLYYFRKKDHVAKRS